jgi:gamma-glutamyltranspeptidase/glutathione hydrolase
MTDESGGQLGAKPAVSGRGAVASSQHPLVTDAMIEVIRGGGNAADAAVAGALVHGTVQQEMTNHTGTISLLYYHAATGEIHELNSMGTAVAELPPVRRVPAPRGDLSAPGHEPFAVIPGFMPGLKALHDRFGTQQWEDLCQPAIHWAVEGHEVNSLEHRVLAQEVDLFLYTPSGRAHFTPDGHLPQVGERWPKPELAKTLKKLAVEGPDYFVTGEWARHFVDRANQLGWPIELRHMTATPPRWGHGVRYSHRGHEIVQLSPPESQAVTCAMVLGILEELDFPAIGHWSTSPEAFYLLAHALRRAAFETGYINDPTIFGDPTAVLMSRDYHQLLAAILRDSMPKVDLTNHVKVTAGSGKLLAAGSTPSQPPGSCELSVVDTHGNWLQMMNTLQTGGIPGEVIDGVPMTGSHSVTNMSSWISGWFAAGSRMRAPMGNTFVLKDGKPWLSLGTPGLLWDTVVQVLLNILDYGMDPSVADDVPRLLALTDDYQVSVESRLSAEMIDGITRLGLLVNPLQGYDWHMGTFQMSWQDADGLLHGVTGPRRIGKATAI